VEASADSPVGASAIVVVALFCLPFLRLVGCNFFLLLHGKFAFTTMNFNVSLEKKTFQTNKQKGIR
jgi:hypothetical protein